MENLFFDSGSYRIYIRLKKTIKIEIGSLGLKLFDKGVYVYTGSAMRNLHSRIERHKRKDKKIRWHIDYLLNNQNVEIINIDSFPSDKREECLLNMELIEKGAIVTIHKFGSSDCRTCPAHLVYFGKEFDLKS